MPSILSSWRQRSFKLHPQMFMCMTAFFFGNYSFTSLSISFASPISRCLLAHWWATSLSRNSLLIHVLLVLRGNLYILTLAKISDDGEVAVAVKTKPLLPHVTEQNGFFTSSSFPSLRKLRNENPARWAHVEHFFCLIVLFELTTDLNANIENTEPSRESGTLLWPINFDT